MVHFPIFGHCQPLSTTHICQNVANTTPHHYYWQCLTQPQGCRYTRRCRPGRGKKVCHYFFILFYYTDVCYRPLGSVNSSMRVPELAKLSLLGLGQPPAILSLSICVLEFTFPFLADHPPPRFCKFEHTSAQIGKTEHCHSWLTTHHLGSANLNMQMLKLAKPSVPALG